MIGIAIIVLKINKNEKQKQFLPYYIACIILLISAIVVPFFASALRTSRLYHIALIILSPMFVIGFSYLLNVIPIIFIRKNLMKMSFVVISIFLIIYLLFNTGFIFEILKDNPTSNSLSNIDYAKFNPQEVACAKWIYLISSSDTVRLNGQPIIVADNYRQLLLYGFFPRDNVYFLIYMYKNEYKYIFMNKYNIDENKVIVTDAYIYTTADGFIKNKNKIFDDNGAYIYTNF